MTHVFLRAVFDPMWRYDYFYIQSGHMHGVQVSLTHENESALSKMSNLCFQHLFYRRYNHLFIILFIIFFNQLYLYDCMHLTISSRHIYSAFKTRIYFCPGIFTDVWCSTFSIFFNFPRAYFASTSSAIDG